MTGLPAHTFDKDRANRFRPRTSFAKTALLVRIADAQDEVILRAPFGKQTMRGNFYVVAEGTGSYGAERSEFEATHTQVAPNRWIKRESVLAYQATERCRVQTMLAEHIESDVIAQVGDWIVRQPAGELIVVKPAKFSERYESTP